MQYLVNWRIYVAAYDLVNSRGAIPEIAQEVGYESEASFTRAFECVMGQPPATGRRQRSESNPGGALEANPRAEVER